MSKKGSFEGANESIDELLNLDLEGKSEDELAEIQIRITNAFQNASQEQGQALAMVSRKINLALSEIASKRNEEISDDTAQEEGAEALPDHEQTSEEALEVSPGEETVSLNPSDEIGVEDEGTKSNFEQTVEEEVKPEDKLIGTLVNWESQGALQFSKPKKVEKIEEKDGEKFVFVEGEKMGFPIDQIVPSDIPDLEEKETKQSDKIAEKSIEENLDSEDWENNPTITLEGSGGNKLEWHIAQINGENVVLKRLSGERESTSVININRLKELVPESATVINETKSKIETENRDTNKIQQNNSSVEDLQQNESNANENSVIINEKELKEAEREIERMTPEEKVELENGLNKWGFILDEKKNEFFAKAFGWAAEKSKSSLFNRLGHGNNLASRFADGMKETFLRDQEASRARAMQMRPGARKAIRSNVLLASNIAKYGRTITDFTGLSLASPTRWVMLASQIFARVADAGKEARLKNEEVLDRTRIQDINEAADQAFEIYKIAELNSGGNVTKEALKQSYLQTLPQDILNRIGKNTKETDSFFQRAVRNDIGWSIGRLRQNIRKIEDNPSYSEAERRQEIQSLIAREQKNLIDYDRILTQTGTADTWAIAGKYLNMAGKTVSAAVSVETIALTGEKIIEHLSSLLSHSESATETAAAIVAHDSVSKDSISKSIVDRLGLHPDTSAHLDTAHASGLDTTHTNVTDSSANIDSTTTSHDSLNVSHSLDSTHITPEGTAVSTDSSASQENIASPQDNEDVSYAIKQQEALERMGDHGSETFGTIHKGGSVTKTIDEMVKQGLISKEDAHIARNNPFSGGMRGEEFIPLDKSGLSYEGNEVHFVPGHDGEAPRFEVVKAEGHQFGSDQDLYNRYIKLGKQPPEWLRKSVEKGWDIPHGQGHIESSLPNNTNPEIISDQELPVPIVNDSAADSLDKTKFVDTAHAVDSTKTTLDSAHKTVGTIESDKNITDWGKIATYGAIGAGLAAAGVGGYAAKKIMEHRKEEGDDVEITDVFKKVKETKASRNQSENLQTEPLPVFSSEKILSDKEIKKLSHDEKVKKILERLSFKKSGFTKADLSILIQNINKRAYVEVYKKLLLKWNESKGNKSARDAILAVNKIISHLPQGDSHAKRFEKRIMDEKQTSTQDQEMQPKEQTAQPESIEKTK